MFRLISAALPESAVQSLTASYFKANAWYHIGKGKFHSKQGDIKYSMMNIKILPALQDNYMYLLVDESTKEAAVIDPVDPKSVIENVSNAGVNLTSVLTTHHHWDHSGGNVELVSKFPTPLTVYGGDDRIGALNKKVSHGDVFNIGKLKVTCLFTPCHTTGHICYYITVPDDDKHQPVVFTGDTLFLGGCGKFFEGTAVEMHKALNEILASLPDDTHVYCGHEYSLNNLSFGIHVEPNNVRIRDKIKWVKEQRQQEKPSVPSSIGEEKEINPFMRTAAASVQDHTKTSTPIETMAALRNEKDSFRPPAL